MLGVLIANKPSAEQKRCFSRPRETFYVTPGYSKSLWVLLRNRNLLPVILVGLNNANRKIKEAEGVVITAPLNTNKEQYNNYV